jgi:hypothetical protein
MIVDVMLENNLPWCCRKKPEKIAGGFMTKEGGKFKTRHFYKKGGNE